MPIQILMIIVGVAVLLLGRRLFWLFVGAVGFLVGVELAGHFISAQPQWVIILIALVIGLIGAVLAVVVQQIAIAAAGLLVGAAITSAAITFLGLHLGRFEWIPLVVGGIIGAIFVIAIFDWALIFLSSLTGAVLIVQPLELRPAVAPLVFLGLLIVGIVVQSVMFARREESPPATPAS
jgi:hypothetical protein